MTPRDLQETALSAANRTTNEQPLDRTTATDSTNSGSAADVTMVRNTPSVTTVPELADPNNFGKYELLGELARGGMGVVYRARQHGLDRLVALKMILGTDADHEAAQRFLQEARSAAALDHPNVVPIYDTGEINGRPYFTMALIDGPNLRGFIDAGAPSIPMVVSLFAQIVAGVAHAHRHGFIHRDLKPANVLIDKDGRPRVTDFGLAKRAAVDSQLTATGQVVGTPQYMAPEQARDSKDVGPPADVYALGAILYFLLTGKPPLTADNLTDLLIKVVSETPESPRNLRPDVPADLEAICLRCLAKSAADRYADADALAVALVPLTDQYLTPSTNLSPSFGQIGLARGSRPSVQSLPDASRPSNTSVLSQSRTAVLPAEEVPTANRKPLVIALGAIAVVMVGVIAFLATRDKKPQETVQQDPPPVVNPGPQQPTPPVVTPPVTPKDGDKFAWPAATRNDFGLLVQLTAPAAKSTDSYIRLTPGTPMTVHLTAEKDCRVSVWVIDPNGHPTKLFPNDDDTDDRLIAGKERLVPGNNNYILESTVTEGAGVERLHVIATTGEPPAYPPGTKVGRFSFYSTDAERERLASTVRGVVLKKAGTDTPATGAMTQAELLFRVQK